MTVNDYATQLNKNGILGFVTSGNSMWPFIKNKKTSVIVTKKEDRLKVHDVAFFVRVGEGYVLHRVMEVLSDGYMVCGDSQTEYEYVKEDNVLGVLCGYYQGKKYIDCSSEEYISAVNDWYNDLDRTKKINDYYRKRRIISRIKKVLTFGRLS